MDDILAHVDIVVVVAQNQNEAKKQTRDRNSATHTHIHLFSPFYFTTCETPSKPPNLTYTCKNTHTVGLPDERTTLSYQYNTCPTLLFAASLMSHFKKLGSRPIKTRRT